MAESSRILVVDDEERICEFLTYMLARAGYEVEAYQSAQEALQALSDRRFHVLLTDLVMPGMDGADLIRYARKVQPDIPAVVLTGFGTVDAAKRVMQAGADDYITKPFDVKQLEQVIARYLTEEVGAADCERMLQELHAIDEALRVRRVDMEDRATKVAESTKETLDQLSIQMAGIRARLAAIEATGQGYGFRQVAEAIAAVVGHELEWPSAAVFVAGEERHSAFRAVAAHNWPELMQAQASRVTDAVAVAAAECTPALHHDMLPGRVVAVAPVIDRETVAALGAASPADAACRGDRQLKVLTAIAEAVAQPLMESLRFRRSQVECWRMAERLIAALESRSRYRKDHSHRLTDYAAALGRELGLDADELAKLSQSAMLCDIGEITMAPSILDKPSPLTESEIEMMKSHAAAGEEIAGHIDTFSPLKGVIRHHHERWDGGGYPDGVAKDDIPLGARIISLADAFDAITSERPYREAQDQDFALAEIEGSAGLQFDPELARMCALAFREARLKHLDQGE